MILETDFKKEFKKVIVDSLNNREKDNLDNYSKMNNTEIFNDLIEYSSDNLIKEIYKKYKDNLDLYNSENNNFDKEKMYDFYDTLNVVYKFKMRAIRNHLHNSYRLKDIESIKEYIVSMFESKAIPMI